MKDRTAQDIRRLASFEAKLMRTAAGRDLIARFDSMETALIAAGLVILSER